MKVVFDTNVVASASFWRGAPFDCLAARANFIVSGDKKHLLALRQF